MKEEERRCTENAEDWRGSVSEDGSWGTRGGGRSGARQQSRDALVGAVSRPLEAPLWLGQCRGLLRLVPVVSASQCCLDVLVSRAWGGVTCPFQDSGCPWKGRWQPRTWLMKE